MLFDLLKFVAALAIIAAVVYYWITEGPPPRGRGRWRSVLSALDVQERKRGNRRGFRGANDYRKRDS